MSLIGPVSLCISPSATRRVYSADALTPRSRSPRAVSGLSVDQRGVVLAARESEAVSTASRRERDLPAVTSGAARDPRLRARLNRWGV